MAYTHDDVQCDTQKLIDGTEGLEIDFKRDSFSSNKLTLKSEALVAFANCDTGGVLLFGVDEIEENGVQKGKIFGCDVSDKVITGIQDIASKCVPPIDIKISIENKLTDKPIIRIDIPSSPLKPHCTPSGSYHIRLDSSTGQLFPEQLFQMFMMKESNSFINKYKKAAEETENMIDMVICDISDTNGKVEKILDNLETKVNHSFESFAEDAQMTLVDILDNTENIKQDLNSDKRISDIEVKLNCFEREIDAIMSKLKIEDPCKIYKLNMIEKEVLFDITPKILELMNKDIKDHQDFINECTEKYSLYHKSIPKKDIKDRITRMIEVFFNKGSK